MHLAQINVAQWKISPEDPRAAGFMDNIDRVNALASRTPGYVWRLADRAEEARALTVFGNDALIINMSVWETPEALEHFVWNTLHKRIYERKDEWFGATGGQRFVMWWIEPGTVPTIDDAKARLDHLNEHGNTDFAFGWAHLPHIKLWQRNAADKED